MQRSSQQGAKRPALLIAAFVAALVLLGALQYRWTGQLSEAQRASMETALGNSTRQFRQEFERELSLLLSVFRPNPAAAADRDWQGYLERYDYWYQVSNYAPLIRRVLLYTVPDGAGADGAESTLYELELEEWRLTPTEWAGTSDAVRRYVAREPTRDGRSFTWTLFAEEMVLALPLLYLEGGGQGRFDPSRLRADGSLIVELDRDYLSLQMIPELVERYFAGPGGESLYQIAVTNQASADARKPAFLYRSSESIDQEWLAGPDAQASLIAFRPRDPRRGPGGGPRGGPNGGQRGGRDPVGGGGPPETRFDPRAPRDRGRAAGGAGPGAGGRAGNEGRQGERGGRGRSPFQGLGQGFGGQGQGGPPAFFGRSPVFFSAGDEGRDWVVTVKHAAGSLEAAVARQRRRDLIVGFGVLSLLATAIGFVMISSQRAKRLAAMQMEFVAGVSHELRTPLSVIRSAGENLADGVIRSEEQLTQYGQLIRDQGRRLSEMVEQTLQLSALESGKQAFRRVPTDVAQVVVETLEQARPAIERNGIELQQVISETLPAADADPEALRHSLENLVSNAVKYAGDSRWVKVEASGVRTNGSQEVQIRVHDRGPGIPPAEASTIFEAFFRGKHATENQIQGSGLGLKLARDMAVGMGGDLTLESEPGKGSIFTIHLPVSAQRSS